MTENENFVDVVNGTILNCDKLNIRKEPDVNAEVVFIADASTEFVIDESASTDAWFSVRTAAGIEGFCMKKFVAVTKR